MTKKRIATLIEQEVQKPSEDTDNSSALAKPLSQRIATTQNTPLAELKLTGQGLFAESESLWKEFIAFDREHHLTERVSAQIWRLTKAVGKPVFVLSIKGIQAAFVTASNPKNRAALAERFARSKPAQDAEVVLESVEDSER